MTEVNPTLPIDINPDSLPQIDSNKQGSVPPQAPQLHSLPTPPPTKPFSIKKLAIGIIILIVVIVLAGGIIFLYQKSNPNNKSIFDLFSKSSSETKKYDFSNDYYSFDIPKGWTFSANSSNIEGLDSNNSLRKITIQQYGFGDEPKQLEGAKKFAANPETIKEMYITKGIGQASCVVNSPTCTKEFYVQDNNLNVARRVYVKIVWEQQDEKNKMKDYQEIDKKFESIKDLTDRNTQIMKFLQGQNMMSFSELYFEDQFFFNFRFALMPGENSSHTQIENKKVPNSSIKVSSISVTPMVNNGNCQKPPKYGDKFLEIDFDHSNNGQLEHFTGENFKLKLQFSDGTNATYLPEACTVLGKGTSGTHFIVYEIPNVAFNAGLIVTENNEDKTLDLGEIKDSK